MGPAGAASLSLAVLAAAIVPAAAEGPVRVYTNVDLEKYGPPSEPVDAAERGDDAGWPFVIDFIERERAELERARRLELDRSVVEAEVRELDRRSLRRGSALPYYHPYGNYFGYGRHGSRGHRVGGKSVKRHKAHRAGPPERSALADLRRPIVPLHARRPPDRPRR